MTTIITRLFQDEPSARRVRDLLHRERVPQKAISVITGTDSGTLTEQMAKARVHPSAAPVYAGQVASGNALLVVRATYKPLGVANLTRRILAEAETVPSDAAPNDYFVRDLPERELSILEDHPRFLTVPVQPGERRGGLVSDEFGIRVLSDRKPRTDSVFRGGRFMSRGFWPMPLVTRNRQANSAIKGGRYMSSRFWPAPLLTNKPRSNSVIRGGDLPLSRYFGWPTISRRG